VWISGQLAELKNYGLACECHRREVLERARDSRMRLEPAYDESIGEVELYPFDPEVPDAELMASREVMG
jgi:hypothetical protein